MNKGNILLLEDDPNLGAILKEHLELNGYEVQLCVNGRDGLTAYSEGGFNLCLVDIMMPKMDGFSFAREVRKKDQQTPLIFLTAKSLKEDKIEGFRIGCDDYLTKPFSMEELLLRITAVLRRTNRQAEQADLPTEFAIGNLTFDYRRQMLIGKKAEIKMTTREAELLRLLCLNLNQTLERGRALREIWGDENYFSGRSMDVFISRLRKYFKDDPRVEIISVHGKGFRLVVNP